MNLIRWGLLGQLHHIRAQWHRGNLPGGDSWKMPIPGVKWMPTGSSLIASRETFVTARKRWSRPRIRTISSVARRARLFQAWDADKAIDPKDFGYTDFSVGNKMFSAMDELHRWRLFERTGAGLMAELGSHQLDAVSIFRVRFVMTAKKCIR